MDLPTYTSIWRIEKRLYKLYDFRLPMPLPIGQVTVFAAVAVPYVVILQIAGLPFNHTLIWLYILPPGLVTWLATRPVLESKRLPELIKSQLRYVAEPKVMCRMVPLAERDVVVVTGRVWRPRTRRIESPEASALTADVLAEELIDEELPDAALPRAEVLSGENVDAGALGEREPAASAAPVRRRRPLPPGRSRNRAKEAAPERDRTAAPERDREAAVMLERGGEAAGTPERARDMAGVHERAAGVGGVRERAREVPERAREVPERACAAAGLPEFARKVAGAPERDVRVAPEFIAADAPVPAAAAPVPAPREPAQREPATGEPARRNAQGGMVGPAGRPVWPMSSWTSAPGGEPSPAADAAAGVGPSAAAPTAGWAAAVPTAAPDLAYAPDAPAPLVEPAVPTAAADAAAPTAERELPEEPAAAAPTAEPGVLAVAVPPLLPELSAVTTPAVQPVVPDVAAVTVPKVQTAAPEAPAGFAVPARPMAEASPEDTQAARAVAASPVTPAPSAAEPAPANESVTTPSQGTAAEPAETAPELTEEPIADHVDAVRTGEPASASGRHADAAPAVAGPGRPQVTVVHTGTGVAPTVERALAGPSTQRPDAWAARVAVVPGGHRPGKPDLLQRDRSRAQRPIGGPARVVVLGCTVGAGQTITALLTGDVLASLRSDRIAVLDLNPGAGSLARRAEARPVLGQAALLSPSRLAVIAPPRAGAHGPFGSAQSGSRADAELAFEAATDRYDLVVADPATAAVPRLLGLADQLVLVAPASGAAPGAVAMTFEWLDAHGHGGLAAGAIMVLNGVSRRSSAHVEQAERVCAGRCRATVRVPWDDQLQERPAPRVTPPGTGPHGRPHRAGVLSPATAGAFTALAGVLVTSLAGANPGHAPAELGRGRR